MDVSIEPIPELSPTSPTVVAVTCKIKRKLRNSSLTNVFVSLGILFRNRNTIGNSATLEIRDLWKTKVAGATKFSATFITSQFDPHRRTMITNRDKFRRFKLHFLSKHVRFLIHNDSSRLDHKRLFDNTDIPSVC